jgi:apolipoprotein N-acyltransferase
MPAIRSFPLKCVLSIVSGAIYASSFPPVGWGWLVFPSIALFLIVLRGESGSRARALGFLHGITAFGIGLSWLVQLFGPAALALWTVLAVFPALFAHFQGAAEKKGITRWKFAIFTTLNWCGWEWIRAEVFPLKFPWMTSGLAMGPNVLLPWIGVYGVGLFVIFGTAWVVGVSCKSFVGYAAVLVSMLRFVSPVAVPEPGDPMALKVGALR